MHNEDEKHIFTWKTISMKNPFRIEENNIPVHDHLLQKPK